MSLMENNIENINAFQVMGIEKIGYQGQEFVFESLQIVKKIKEIREKLKNVSRK